MGRTGFVIFTMGILLGVPLLYAGGVLTLDGSLEATCAASQQMGCAMAMFAGMAVAPLLILVAGIGMGIVVLLRARAASLSGLWGFFALVLTVQAMAMIAGLAIQSRLGLPDAPPLVEHVLGTAPLWLLGILLLFLLLVPEWRGPPALDIGLSLVAAVAAIIVVAVGHSVRAMPFGYFLEFQRAVAAALENVPNVEWIALGVFATALAGIWIGRLMPEAE
jgi:hypothetical protein